MASRVATPSIFHACRRPYPDGNRPVLVSLTFPASRRPSPWHVRVGSRVVVFEACSAFTHVSARVVAEPPTDLALPWPCPPFPASCAFRESHIVRGPSTEVLQFMSLPPCTASAATGWNDSCRTGFAPARKVRLSTAHRADATTPAKTSRCSCRSLPGQSAAFPFLTEGRLSQ